MDRDLRNIFIQEKAETLKYRPVSSRGGEGNYTFRNSRIEHGNYIESQFITAWKRSERDCANRLAVSANTRNGVYLQVKGKEGCDLITKSLENVGQKVRLLNIQEKDGIETAVVFVPNEKKDFFLKKINEYRTASSGTEVIGTIENINEAMVESMWIGDARLICFLQVLFAKSTCKKQTAFIMYRIIFKSCWCMICSFFTAPAGIVNLNKPLL